MTHSRLGSSPVTCTKTSRRNTACFLLLIHFKTAVAELRKTAVAELRKTAVAELHEIFDFVEAELVPQTESAGFRCR